MPGFLLHLDRPAAAPLALLRPGRCGYCLRRSGCLQSRAENHPCSASESEPGRCPSVGLRPPSGAPIDLGDMLSPHTCMGDWPGQHAGRPRSQGRLPLKGGVCGLVAIIVLHVTVGAPLVGAQSGNHRATTTRATYVGGYGVNHVRLAHCGLHKALQYHSPLEGESQKPSRRRRLMRRGGQPIPATLPTSTSTQALRLPPLRGSRRSRAVRRRLMRRGADAGPPSRGSRPCQFASAPC